ncbi:MAG: hypothetical protein FWE80_03010, partial [Oscillospiraceae bacterium]|nr:hypothetical protein [Oscillospiraceae bacterium]
MGKQIKKIFGSGLQILLVLAFLFVSLPTMTVQANPADSGYTVEQVEEPPVYFIEEDGILLPVGGISPFVETEVSGVPGNDVIAEARVRSLFLRAYMAISVPGGSRYGYDWIANAANTGADSAALIALYEGLISYAEAAYYSTSDFVTGNATVINAGSMMINTLNLPVNTNSLNLIRLAFAAFSRDNPQYYFFNNGFSYGNNGSIYTVILLHVSEDYQYYTERQRIAPIIEAKYAEYAALTASVSGDYDKARLVHDKICAERDYSYYNGEPDGNAYAHDILGVLDLDTHGPVCESYAKAYAYILNRLGIETLIIYGQAGSGGSGGGGGHAWNMININGTYYYVDTTWDDFETVGNMAGSWNDEGNWKNQLYYKYFMSGSSNPDFLPKHTAGTPTGGNMYYQPGLPAVSGGDYNTLTGSTYKWLTDNGYFNNAYSYGPDYTYYIGYSNNVGYPTESPTALFINNSGWYFNNWRTRDFGSYTVSPTATDLKVTGSLWNWSFDRSKGGFNTQFSNPVALIQDTDYEIYVEKPYKAGPNRAYIYVKGGYRGIDFAVVNLTFASASASAGNVTVSGDVGAALTGSPSTVITLSNASVVRGGLNNVNATGWFANMPAGVTATANAAGFSETITITFSGTPAAGSSAAFAITIPQTAQTGGRPMTVAANANAKFAIAGKGEQAALNITGLNSSYTVGSVITLETTGGSGSGAVSYVSSNTGVATVSGSTFTLVGIGTFTITATKAGDAQFNDKSVTSGIITVSALWAGAGTETNPYLIANAADLARLAMETNKGTYVNKYFKMTADIDLAGYDAGDGGWMPIGNYSNSFSGYFDGSGYTVTNMTINRPNARDIGLFGRMLNGAIRNVNVSGATVVGDLNVGGIAGDCWSSSTLIENCHFTGTINGQHDVGGIAGGSIGTIINCSNAGAITGENSIGGIVGDSYATITNCHNIGTVTGEEYIGGITGYNNYRRIISDCTNSGDITGTVRVGGIAGYNSSNVIAGYSPAAISNCTNTGAVGGESLVGGIVGWNLGIIEVCENTGAVIGEEYVGGIAGGNASIYSEFSDYPAVIRSCTNTGAVSGKDTLGGIAGINVDIIEYCENTGNVIGTDDNIGGIVGSNTTTITLFDEVFDMWGSEALIDNCTNRGYVNGRSQVGGIAGCNENEIIYCVNNHDVIGRECVGGIAGTNDGGLIRYCYNAGWYGVSGEWVIGGIAGYNKGYGGVADCANEGQVYALYSSSGGICGENSGDISYCQNMGGVFGRADYGHATGGIAGGNGGVIGGCINTGEVSGGNWVGGITGGNAGYNGYIVQCFNTGAVTGNNGIGGLAGENSYNARITDCYNTGTVTAYGDVYSGIEDSKCGGIAGDNYGTVTNCYNTGALEGTVDFRGGIAGYNEGALINCYYNNEIHTGPGIGAGNGSVTGLSTAEMVSPSFAATLGEVFDKRDTDEDYCYYPELSMFMHYGSHVYPSKTSATVARRTPVLLATTPITYGQSLYASAVGFVDPVTGKTVTGTSAWTNGATAYPAVSDSNTTNYGYTFTPAYADLYKTLSDTAKVTVNKAAGAAVGKPDWEARATTMIGVYTVAAPANGQTVEYAISTSASADPAALIWQPSPAFTGLSPDTDYYVYARSAANANYNAGTASVSDVIRTNPATYGISLDRSGTHTFAGAVYGYGAQTPLTVTVTNTGNQPSGGLTVALSGANASAFALNKTSIGSLAVSGSDTFTVAPKTGLDAGTYTATVTVSGGSVAAQSFHVSFTVEPELLPPYAVYHYFPEQSLHNGYIANEHILYSLYDGYWPISEYSKSAISDRSPVFAINGIPLPAFIDDTGDLVLSIVDLGLSEDYVYHQGCAGSAETIAITPHPDPDGVNPSATPPHAVNITIPAQTLHSGFITNGDILYKLSQSWWGTFEYNINAVLTSHPVFSINGIQLPANITATGELDITISGGLDLKSNYWFAGYAAGAPFRITVLPNPDPTYGISLDKSGTQTFPAAAHGYGAQTPLTAAVTNTGSHPAGALTIALSGPDASRFTLSKTAVGNVGDAGETFTVTPVTGLAPGTYTATVTVSGGAHITARSFDVSFTVISLWAGTGTETDPYLIANVADLARLAVEVNGGNAYAGTYFKMTADIDLAGYDAGDGGGWMPIGNFTSQFKGNFDGDNHVVRNLIIDRSSTHFIGLFGYFNGGKVKNLGIFNGDIKGSSFVGGIIGHNDHGIIENCYNNASITGTDERSYAGGVVGLNYDGTVIDCYNTNIINGDSFVGGVVGANNDSKSIIKNCYNVGAVNGTNSSIG